jgi:hypothetical protein
MNNLENKIRAQQECKIVESITWTIAIVMVKKMMRTILIVKCHLG